MIEYSPYFLDGRVCLSTLVFDLVVLVALSKSVDPWRDLSNLFTLFCVSVRLCSDGSKRRREGPLVWKWKSVLILPAAQPREGLCVCEGGGRERDGWHLKESAGP